MNARSDESPTLAEEIAQRLRHEHALLGEFKKAVDQYEAKKASVREAHSRKEHGDLAKMLESALIDYFGDALPPGLRLGEGTPVLESVPTHNAQTDLVVDVDGDVWTSSRHAPRHLSNEPVYMAAIEVRYRGPQLRKAGPKAVAKNAMQVVRRLQEITSRALDVRRKCWTAAVLLGPGFDMFNRDGTGIRPRALGELAAALRAFYVPRSLVKQDIGEPVGTTWPFVDMIVLPGLLLKKHTLFAMPERAEHPMYMVQPTIGPTALRTVRPLSTAKGYLRHGLRALADGDGFQGPAWSDAEDPIYAGPVVWPPIRSADDELAVFRAYSRAIVLDGTTGPLYHQGSGPDGIAWFEVGPSSVVPGTFDAVSGQLLRWP